MDKFTVQAEAEKKLQRDIEHFKNETADLKFKADNEK